MYYVIRNTSILVKKKNQNRNQNTLDVQLFAMKDFFFCLGYKEIRNKLLSLINILQNISKHSFYSNQNDWWVSMSFEIFIHKCSDDWLRIMAKYINIWLWYATPCDAGILKVCRHCCRHRYNLGKCLLWERLLLSTSLCKHFEWTFQ